MPAPLHGKGWLQNDVEKVVNAFLAGKIKLEKEGGTLTPATVAKIVQKAKKMDEPPSTGAVAAVFDRWEKYGIATFHPKPRAFKAWTAAYKKDGIDGAKARRLEERRAARAAAKPPKPPAKKAAAKKAPAKKKAAAKKA